jgi:hypothetical protein
LIDKAQLFIAGSMSLVDGPCQSGVLSNYSTLTTDNGMGSSDAAVAQGSASAAGWIGNLRNAL